MFQDPRLAAPEDLALPPRRETLLQSFAGMTGNIVVFGGSFDPLHIDHLNCAAIAQAHLGDATLVFMPNKRNPDKGNAAWVTPQDRLEMLKLALAPLDKYFVSDYELNSPLAQPMTFDTMAHIKQAAHPDARLFLLLGSDILKYPQYFSGIAAKAETFMPIFIERETFKKEELSTLAGRIPAEDLEYIDSRFLTGATIGTSSTAIRASLKNGLIPPEVPAAVGDYIIDKGLYGFSFGQGDSFRQEQRKLDSGGADGALN